MAKQQYIMADEIGVVGNQVAGTKARAEDLFFKRTGERVTAYSYAENPPGFNPSPMDWEDQDRQAGYIR